MVKKQDEDVMLGNLIKLNDDEIPPELIEAEIKEIEKKYKLPLVDGDSMEDIF